MKNIRTNAIANFLVRVFNVVFPLITAPYINRVMHNSDGYGYFNGADSLLLLFIPFATFGVYNYGIRQISKAKHDPEQVNRIFSTLFYLTIAATTITTLVYILYVTLSAQNNEQLTIYLVMASQIAVQFLYIEWMNEALEDYRFILYKTLFIRVVMLGLLLTFVHKAEDVLIYAMIMSGIQILNYLISFIWIKRQVKLVKVPLKEITVLILPLLGLLLMANAGTLYTILDRIVLERIAPPQAVTDYVQGQKIAMMIAGLISGPVSVSIPRLGYYLGIKDNAAYDALVYKGSKMFAFFIVPVSVGLFLTGSYVMALFGGPAYMKAGEISSVFGIRCIAWALEILLANQVIFIHGYEQKLTTALFSCGLLNLVFKVGLVSFGIKDPVFYIATTLLAECVLIGWEFLIIKQNNLINVKPIVSDFMRYTLYTLGFIPIYLGVNYLHPVSMHVSMPFLVNLTMIIGGSVIYYVLLLWYKQDPIFISVWDKVKQKITRGGTA